MAATAWQTALVLGFVMLGTMQAFWVFAPLYGFGYGGVMTGVRMQSGRDAGAAS